MYCDMAHRQIFYELLTETVNGGIAFDVKIGKQWRVIQASFWGDG